MLSSFQFIHDPLLSWRLDRRELPPQPSFPSERRASIMCADYTPTSSERPTSSRHRSRSSAQRPQQSQAQAERAFDRLTLANSIPTGAQQDGAVEDDAKEVQNARALQVLGRVKDKLSGTDFKKTHVLTVEEQVDRLLREATNLENLCQHYIGWCSFW